MCSPLKNYLPEKADRIYKSHCGVLCRSVWGHWGDAGRARSSPWIRRVEPQSQQGAGWVWSGNNTAITIPTTIFVYFHATPHFCSPIRHFSKGKVVSSPPESCPQSHYMGWAFCFFEMLLVTHRWVYSDSRTSNLHQFPLPSVLPLSSLCHPRGSWWLHHRTEGQSRSAFHSYPGSILHSQCQLQPSFWWQCLWQWPCFPPNGSSFVSNCSPSQNAACVILRLFQGLSSVPGLLPLCLVLN